MKKLLSIILILLLFISCASVKVKILIPQNKILVQHQYNKAMRS
ncbi:hypothetical protein [Caloramator sp. Dgby_cultured_2]|nr:hypothetical protein [Caloramator sp. Dgby_cultured_2]WDU83787.1 hypothetical protein PWK10_04415 [Caloramator sp. Dgby_cultured_2]